jgi:hypothetical protein
VKHFLFSVLVGAGVALSCSPLGSNKQNGSKTLAEITPFNLHDFAQIFPKENPNPVQLNDTLPSGEPLITVTQFEQLKNALTGSRQVNPQRDFARSPLETWQLMALRFEPCAPLGLAPFQLADTVCEPELRLVFQPILKNAVDPVPNGSAPTNWPVVPYFAMDKGIHMLFDSEETGYLTLEEKELYSQIKSKFQKFVQSGSFNTLSDNPLSDAELAQFKSLRNKLIMGFKQDLQLLLEEIPLEITTEIKPQALLYTSLYKGRMHTFLGKVGGFRKIKQLTLFTVNEAGGGERPASSWGGAFVSLIGKKGQLEIENQAIINSQNGKPILNPSNTKDLTLLISDVKLDNTENGKFAGDPFKLKPCVIGLDSGKILASQTLVDCGFQFSAIRFDTPEYERFAKKISHRSETLIPNTSCLSCHSVDVAYAEGEVKKRTGPNALFNFHNMSELSFVEDVFEGGKTVGKKAFDLGFRVSRRVQEDVKFDLEWVKINL